MSETTNILQLGNPTLAQISTPVEDILSDSTQQTINEMLNSVIKAKGVGIAAPQIGINKRIFIMCSKPNSRYPNAPLMEPTAIINPEILTFNGDIEADWEGCLSVPSIRGLIPRYSRIQVSYYDTNNIKHQKTFNGFLARVFQHEFDHLNGLTFLDRVNSAKDLCSELEWYKQFTT